MHISVIYIHIKLEIHILLKTEEMNYYVILSVKDKIIDHCDVSNN